MHSVSADASRLGLRLDFLRICPARHLKGAVTPVVHLTADRQREIV